MKGGFLKVKRNFALAASAAANRIRDLPPWYRELLEKDHQDRMRRIEEKCRLWEKQINEPG